MTSTDWVYPKGRVTSMNNPVKLFSAEPAEHVLSASDFPNQSPTHTRADQSHVSEK
jgi:hypothetical protein